MDDDEVLLGFDQKLLKKLMQFNNESSENSAKCKPEEVNELLSLQKTLLEQPRYEKRGALSEAEWDNDLKLAKVTKVAKNLTKNFAHTRNKSLYLYPEECLCLMDMKCLVLTCKERQLSMKSAFALLLNFDSGCTFEQFRTYGYLVKLGFRVFRHDERIKRIDFSPKDLVKQPVKTMKKQFTGKKQIKNSQDRKNKEDIPNTKYTSWVISRPSLHLIPYNLQPHYNTYSFNIAIKPDGQTKITEMISSHKLDYSEFQKTFPKAPLLHDLQPTGVYPVYEKNIPVVKTSVNDQNKDINYVPPVKKSKLTKTVDVNLAVCTSTDNCNKHTLNSETNSFEVFGNINSAKTYEIKEASSFLHNVSVSTSKATSNAFVSNNETETMNNLQAEKKQQSDEETVKNFNFNRTGENHSNCELQKLISNTTLEDCEDNIFDKQLNIPSHIGDKLLAVKSKTIHEKLTDDEYNEHRVHYDVYYPDNNVAKTTRSAPNFRVIVFEDGDIENFPNVYKVTVSTPSDNVPLLWAIVNSSQVSFFNVDSIILPKSSAWEVKKK